MIKAGFRMGHKYPLDSLNLGDSYHPQGLRQWKHDCETDQATNVDILSGTLRKASLDDLHKCYDGISKLRVQGSDANVNSVNLILNYNA